MMEKFDGRGDLFRCAEDAGYGVHGGNGGLIVSQGLFISIHCTVKITHQFVESPLIAYQQDGEDPGIVGGIPI